MLTFDYLGALAVSIAFPLLLVPQLGLVRTGALFGLMNAAVAVWALWLFRGELRRFAAHALACALAIAALLAALRSAPTASRPGPRTASMPTTCSTARRSPYQRVVVTASRAGVRLFLNGNLQFHSRDEYRYHEALVHPAMAAHGAPKRVLVLGGGDGMAVREVLKYPSVEQRHAGRARPAHDAAVLDPAAAARAQRRRAALAEARASSTPTRSAGSTATTTTFDVIVVDFPDPTNFSIGKLYTSSFYRLVDQHLSAERLRGRADHLAADRAQELLDRRDDDRVGRPRGHAVPRARAELRRMGLHPRQPAPVPDADARCRRACAS